MAAESETIGSKWRWDVSEQWFPGSAKATLAPLMAQETYRWMAGGGAPPASKVFATP